MASAFKILPSVNRIVQSMQRWKFSKPVIDQVYEDLIGAKDEISYPKNIKINNIDIKNLFFL